MNRLLSAFSSVLFLCLSFHSVAADDVALTTLQAYQESLATELIIFNNISQEETEKYKANISRYWDNPEISSKTVWVAYSDDFLQKSRVDFARGSISITCIEQNDKASVDIKGALIKLLKTSKKQAFEQDQLSQAIEKRSKAQLKQVETADVKKAPILLPLLTERTELTHSDIEAIVDRLLLKKKIVKHKNKKNKTVLTVQVPLQIVDKKKDATTASTEGEGEDKEKPTPDDGGFIKVLAGFFSTSWVLELALTEKQKKLPRKAQMIAQYVAREAKKYHIAEPLVYALIEVESAFNPMAKSTVPAYGLMQIVPESAGQDATSHLFGEPRILAPSYLYNSEKNIEIGVVYLNILYFRYLSAITDPISRLYCTIAAYNTGASNVARAFVSHPHIDSATKKINTMTPDQVYSRLMTKLPYKETRNYLKKINRLLPKYRV